MKRWVSDLLKIYHCFNHIVKKRELKNKTCLDVLWNFILFESAEFYLNLHTPTSPFFYFC